MLKKVVAQVVALLVLLNINIFAYQHEINIYISQTGSDIYGNGSIERPYLTLSKAQDLARSWIRSGTERNINVILRAGTYTLDKTLSFNSADSGNGTGVVTYKAHNNEEVILTGAKRVDSWNAYQNGIYYADVGTGYTFSALYEGEARAIKARHPNRGDKPSDGYLNTYAQGDDIVSSFVFNNNDFPFVANQNDLQVYLFSGGTEGIYAYFSHNFPVTVDYTARKVTFETGVTTKNRQAIGVGSRYYMLNALEFLDDAGEFYFDSAAGRLYYKPYSEQSIQDNNIFIPYLKTIISVQGRPGLEVKNLAFDGLTIKNVDANPHNKFGVSRVINISYGENIAVKNCHIYNCGGTGILYYYSTGCTAYGNYIHDVGGAGIYIRSDLNRPDGGNTVSNNYIHDVGTYEAENSGIAIVKSSGNTISHNRITDVPRAAINLEGTPKYFLVGTTIDGVKVTEQNVGDYLTCNDNVIEFNDMSNAMRETQDGGVYYTWGVGYNNILRNNLIHDSHIHFSFGFGVYLDDDTHKHLLKDNIIYNLGTQGGELQQVTIVKGQQNKMENSISAFSQPIGGDFRVDGNASFGSVGRARYTNNIQYETGGRIYGFYNYDKYAAGNNVKLEAADYNTFYSSGEDYRVLVRDLPGRDYKTLATFANWQRSLISGGFARDQNSICANPMFVDAQNYDFRLMKDSPAYTQGFIDINVRDIGLKKDFKYADKSDLLSRVHITADEDDFRAWKVLSAGESFQLSAIARTDKGFISDSAYISYTSSNDRVAAVSADGVVTGAMSGEAIITVKASTKDGHVLSNYFVYVD